MVCATIFCQSNRLIGSLYLNLYFQVKWTNVDALLSLDGLYRNWGPIRIRYPGDISTSSTGHRLKIRVVLLYQLSPPYFNIAGNFISLIIIPHVCIRIFDWCKQDHMTCYKCRAISTSIYNPVIKNLNCPEAALFCIR